MSEGNEVLDNTVLSQFLGADGVEELRTKIIDVIVEEVRDQLKQSSSYIISPDDICTEIFDRVVNDLYEEISTEYKKKVSEAVEKKLAGLGM